jgi:hypothetical protein
MAMKMLSVLAMSAALIATGAAAQSVASDSGTGRPGAAATHRSHVTHQSRVREGSRERGAYATVSPGRLPERARGGASAFDGSWSVLIITQSGACDRSYRYGVQISNGQVHNAGGEPIALSGRVAPSGAVSVSVAAGGQSASGAGRLTQTSGGGSWRGQGSQGFCAGTWRAARRG